MRHRQISTIAVVFPTVLVVLGISALTLKDAGRAGRGKGLDGKPLTPPASVPVQTPSGPRNVEEPGLFLPTELTENGQGETEYVRNGLLRGTSTSTKTKRSKFYDSLATPSESFYNNGEQEIQEEPIILQARNASLSINPAHDQSTAYHNESPLQQRILQSSGGLGGDIRPTDPPLVAPPVTSMVYFIYDFGFETGLAKEPTLGEVDEFMCRAVDFTRDRISGVLAVQGDNKPISVRFWYIDWSFDQANTLPLNMAFHGDVRYADDSAFVSKDTVMDAFRLTAEDVAAFIKNYIWSVSINNAFYYVNQVDYRARSVEPLPKLYRLERSACEVTRAPTVAPEVTDAPTRSPVETNAPAPDTTISPGGGEGDNPNAPDTPSETNAPDKPSETNAPAPGGGTGGIPDFPIGGIPITTAAPGSTPSPGSPDSTPSPDSPYSTPITTSSPDIPESTSAPDSPSSPNSPESTNAPDSPSTTPAPSPSSGGGGGGGINLPVGGFPGTTGAPGSTPAPDTTETTNSPAITDAPDAPGSPSTPGSTPAPDTPNGTGDSDSTSAPNPSGGGGGIVGGIPNIPVPGSPGGGIPATPAPEPTSLAPTTLTPTVSPGAPSASPTSAAPTDMPWVPVPFRLEFSWRKEDYSTRQPNAEEILDALCYTQRYFWRRLQVAITNDVVLIDVTNVDWRHYVTGNQGQEVGRLEVNMTVTAVHGEMLELIAPNVVISALRPSRPDLLKYIIDHEGNGNIFEEREDHLFLHFSHIELDEYPLSTELAEGRMPVLQNCPEGILDPNPDLVGEPLNPETPNLPEPADIGGTSTPTVAFEEATLAPTQPPGPPQPTVAPVPTAKPVSLIPEGAGYGTLDDDTDEDFVPVGPGDGPVTVEITFIVSNLNYITLPTEVNRSGLSDAFPLFMEEVAWRFSRDEEKLYGPPKPQPEEWVPPQRRRLIAGTDSRTYCTFNPCLPKIEDGSASITQLVQTDCGENTHPDLVCHNAEAQFNLLAKDDANASIIMPVDWRDDFVLAAYRTIHDGTFDKLLRQRSPGTPLYIGTVPLQPEETPFTQQSLFWILVGVAIALLLLLCCLFCCLLFQRRKHEKEMKQRDDDDARRLSRGLHHHHHRPSKSTEDTDVEADTLLKKGNSDDYSSEDDEYESDVFQLKGDGPGITEDSFVDDSGEIDLSAYGVVDDLSDEKEKEEAAVARSLAPAEAFEDEPLLGKDNVQRGLKESAPQEDDMDDVSLGSSSSSSTSDSSSSDSSSNSGGSGKSSGSGARDPPAVDSDPNADLERSVQLEEIFNLSRPLESTIEYQKKQKEEEKAKALEAFTPLPTLDEQSVGSYDTTRSESVREDDAETPEPVQPIDVAPPSPPVLIEINSSEDEEIEADTVAETFNEVLGNDNTEENPSRSSWGGGFPSSEEKLAWAGGTGKPEDGGGAVERGATSNLETGEKESKNEKRETSSLEGGTGTDPNAAVEAEEEKSAAAKALPKASSDKVTSALLKFQQVLDLQKVANQSEKEKEHAQNKVIGDMHAGAEDTALTKRRAKRGTERDEISDEKYNKYNNSDEAVAWDYTDEPPRSRYNDSDESIAWDYPGKGESDSYNQTAGSTSAGDRGAAIAALVGKKLPMNLSDQLMAMSSGDSAKFHDATVKKTESSGESNASNPATGSNEVKSQWAQYDETVAGLRSIGSSHHNKEEVISFDDSDDDVDDDEWEDGEKMDSDKSERAASTANNYEGSSDAFKGDEAKKRANLLNSSGHDSDWVDYASSDPNLSVDQGESGHLSIDDSVKSNVGAEHDVSAGKMSIDDSAEDHHKAGSSGDASSSSSGEPSNVGVDTDEDFDEDDIEWEDYEVEKPVASVLDQASSPMVEEKKVEGAENEHEKQSNWENFVGQQEYDSDSYSEHIDWEEA